MKNIGRLPDNATIEQRLEKFSSIAEGLEKNGITLEGLSGGNPVLVDESCEFKLTHNLMTWEVYNTDDVVEMIVKARDKKRDGETK